MAKTKASQTQRQQEVQRLFAYFICQLEMSQDVQHSIKFATVVRELKYEDGTENIAPK